MPKPRDGESEQEFISRCMSDPAEQELRPDQAARFTRCNGIWESERMTVSNEKLLDLIRARSSKQTEFGYGITTADRFVKTLEDCVGHAACDRYACAVKGNDWQGILTKARQTLVYSNPDMVTEGKVLTSLTSWKEALGVGELEIELPKNALMVFSHVLTTPRKDRDGDVLRSEGARLDPKMLLLWQHIPTLPIGKMLATLEQNKERVKNLSCIIDMNDLCHDAAVMIDNGMSRYSHGFRALEYVELKGPEYEDGTPNGFDIRTYEIMEESQVSIPSNADAEDEEVLLSLVEGGKLTSGIMKDMGSKIREKRPTSVNVPRSIVVTEKYGDYERTIEGDPETVKEFSNENKPRSRGSEEQGEGQKQRDCSCPSKETNENSSQETATAGNPQVETEKGYPLQGSWEDIEQKLYRQAKNYLELNRISVRDRFVWIAGTFPDHAIICTESYESGIVDEFLYYRGKWDLEDGEPQFKEAPEPVDIVTTTEIRERSPLFSEKSVDSKNLSVEQAIGVIISSADKDQRAQLRGYMAALDDIEKSTKTVEFWKSLSR